jgi:hypothetical protein
MLALLLICVACGTITMLYQRKSTDLPPGPFAFPMIGNLLHFPLPMSHPWFRLTHWKKEFGMTGLCAFPAVSHRATGNIVYIHGLRNSIVVLNDLESVTDLLTKRGHLYADRPIFTMGGELMGLDRVGVTFSARPRTDSR